MRKILASVVATLLVMPKVLAHCPLCTIGAAAAAGGANYLGVNQFSIGIFIGAFAVSIGWWVSRLLPKQYIPLQREVLILISFVTTIFPLVPLFSEAKPLLINVVGSYGTLLNTTYVINLFFVGSVLGGVVVSVAPWLSERVTALRKGEQLPYQGMTLMFVLLMVGAIIGQVVL